jgi:hypothetical protein
MGSPLIRGGSKDERFAPRDPLLRSGCSSRLRGAVTKPGALGLASLSGTLIATTVTMTLRRFFYIVIVSSVAACSPARTPPINSATTTVMPSAPTHSAPNPMCAQKMAAADAQPPLHTGHEGSADHATSHGDGKTDGEKCAKMAHTQH